MGLRAGFAEVDITPPPGTHKIGWLRDLVGHGVLDPLHVRVAIIASGGRRIAFVQLDTLCVRWTFAGQVRQLARDRHGIAPENLMVSATHNHAGPAVANCGEAPRDGAYNEELLSRIAAALGRAEKSMRQAQIAIGGCPEFRVAHNRRVVMRDGTVRTHGSFADPDALYLEGPIDPEVAVLAARSPSGELLGAIVNYSCHPTHNGDGPHFSAGYPGVLASCMRLAGCPVTLFLNGACGNTHTSDPTGLTPDTGMERAGKLLCEDALRVIQDMRWRDRVRLRGASRTVDLPYRRPSAEEVSGTIRGAQRFVDPALYDRVIPGVLERIRQRGTQPAEVQVLSVDEYAFCGIPAEYFVELGLRIKERSRPFHALVVSCANGMVGYVPHRDAFERGGYETTFMGTSRMAVGAGETLADCAAEMVGESG